MTANQAYKNYKKSGGTLSFAEYIDREKRKEFVNFSGDTVIPTNKPLTDSIANALNQIHRQQGLQTELQNKYIFGINKNAWIIAGVVTAVVIGVVIYKKTSK